jgi:hypothetical protein
MTDESDLLRRLIEQELSYHLASQPHNRPPSPREIARRVAEDVLRQLDRLGAQVVRMHALGPRRE